MVGNLRVISGQDGTGSAQGGRHGTGGLDGRIEVHYGAELEVYALRDTQPRGSSDYGTRSPSLPAESAYADMEDQPDPADEKDIKPQNIPRQGGRYCPLKSLQYDL